MSRQKHQHALSSSIKLRVMGCLLLCFLRLSVLCLLPLLEQCFKGAKKSSFFPFKNVFIFQVFIQVTLSSLLFGNFTRVCDKHSDDFHLPTLLSPSHPHPPCLYKVSFSHYFCFVLWSTEHNWSLIMIRAIENYPMETGGFTSGYTTEENNSSASNIHQ